MDFVLKLINDAIFFRVICEAGAAAFIAPAFAMLFAVPAKYLIWTAIGGGITRFIRSSLVLEFNVEIVVATFIACAITSLIFIYKGPQLKVPRPVFTVASIISLIPGMDAYNALLSLMAVIDNDSTQIISDNVFELFHRGMRCISIMLSIALGIAVPPLFFYRYRHSHL